jgi:hypothetical protein
MPKTYISIAIQRIILALSQGYCEYCLVPEDYSTDFFKFDHIHPRILGGQSIVSNLARTCGICNGLKYAKIEGVDPLTGGTCRLFHPRQEVWHDHFYWSKDELQIMGKTIVGRTTIELLQVNRKSNINLRKLLKMAGLHPPILS